jgi:hypothetical protein
MLSYDSYYSIVFTANFLPNKGKKKIETPYYSLRSQTFEQPINKIIIKLCAINIGNSSKTNFLYKLQNYKGWDEFLQKPDISYIQKSMQDLDAFETEISSQIKTSLLTCNYLESLCPFPVFTKAYNKSDSISFLKRLLSEANSNNDISVNTVLQSFISNLQENKINGLGLIAMEFAEGFDELKNLNSNLNFELYKNISRYQLLQLALSTGYTTGDFHMGNILLNPTYSKLDIPIPSYFTPLKI